MDEPNNDLEIKNNWLVKRRTSAFDGDISYFHYIVDDLMDNCSNL